MKAKRRHGDILILTDSGREVADMAPMDAVRFAKEICVSVNKDKHASSVRCFVKTKHLYHTADAAIRRAMRKKK